MGEATMGYEAVEEVVMPPYVPAIARTLLGLAFTASGLNFYLHFAPLPAMPAAATRLLDALVESGWIMAVVKPVEIGAGLLLLLDRFVPLALTLLAPILVNVVAFHAILVPAAAAPPLLLLALELFLAWTYRASFEPMLRAIVPVDGARAPSTRISNPERET